MARLMDPPKNGKFPFTYVPAASTDVAKTFAAVRKRIAEEKKRAAAFDSQVTVFVQRAAKK